MRQFALYHNAPLDDQQKSEKIDKIFPFLKFVGQCPCPALLIHHIWTIIRKVETFCVRKFDILKLNLFEWFDLVQHYSSEEVVGEVMRKKSIASQLPAKKIPVQSYPKQLMVQIRFHKVGTIDTKNQIFHATIEVRKNVEVCFELTDLDLINHGLYKILRPLTQEILTINFVLLTLIRS